MKSLLEKMGEILPEDRPRHSYFQIKHFIIGKEPTVQGRLHTCLNELRERKQSLEALEVEIAEQIDNHLLLEAEKHALPDPIHVRKITRKINQILKQVEKLRQKSVAIEQESLFLMEMYEDLLKQEPLKDWDDFEVQAEYWNAKLLHELRTSLLLTGKVNNDLISSIMALPRETAAHRQLISLFHDKLEHNKETAKRINQTT